MKELNPEQKQAVEYLSGPLLVLAGPGTGKTQLLSAKVQYILEHTDANPENILCLTFTDAGAENMRDRLQTMIGQAASEVNIYTYHAFGRNLLERYQNYAEAQDRKLDTPIDEIMQHKIVTEIQAELPARDILKQADVGDLLSTISSSKAARLTADDLTKIAEQNLKDSEAISSAISPILSSATPRMKFTDAVDTVYNPLLEVFAEFSSPEPIVKNIERIANGLLRELDTLIKECSAADKPSVAPLTAWRRKIVEQTDSGAWRLKDYIANKKLASLANIMAKYDSALETKGLFDFNDMIERTIDFLKEDRGFRLNLSELFQYVLLDEFQDTNASQFELIKLLTDYEQPVVMAVGDDDQAIYEFQGANASNLMDFREHYNAEVISLVKNYRSTSEILDLSRKIADQIDNSFARNYKSVQKTLTAVFNDQILSGLDSSQVSRHEFPAAEAEYMWIARRIREMIDAGADPTKIAILAPKHKNLVAILPYLKHENIDVAYEKRENLLQDERMHIIIQIAKFIKLLADGKQPSYLLPEILSYDFWGIPATKAFQVFADRYSHENALELLEDHEDYKPLAKFFADLAAKSFTAPLELWLSYLIGLEELNGFRSPFLQFYSEHGSDAEQLEFYESLATFRSRVKTYTASLSENANSTSKLTDFITMITDFEAAGAEIMRISNYRDSGHSVQVMTAFKSKGLEFQHVFLTSVDELAWGRAKGNNNTLTLPRNLTQIRHTGISDDERLRVLFVAMTRAKQSLTMTNSQKNSDGKSIARLGYLSESSPEDEQSLSPFLPTSHQNIELHQDDFDLQDKIETMKLGWIANYQKSTPELEPLLVSRLENYRLTASDLTSFIDLIYAGPVEIYRRRALHAPDEPATPEQCYGTLAHAIFEQVVTGSIDDETALRNFRELVPNTPLDIEQKQQLLDAGTYNLEIALRKFGDILRRSGTKAEVNLSPEHLNFDNVPLTGKIDLIEIDPETKTIEVYDYKTGKYHPEKWNSHPSLYKYRLQLGFYKLLLNLSPTFAKYKVTCGHILFVTPDNDGEVYDKRYDFDPQDEEELKKLIRVVYQEIKTLDFAKNPDIFRPSDRSNSMKQIREFVDKLLKLDTAS